MDGWPVVGRHKELSELTSALVAKRGALITGPAGVGKTTVAAMGAQMAQKRGMSLVRTTATHASRGLPFGAFASMLPPDPGDDPLSRAANLGEEVGDLIGATSALHGLARLGHARQVAARLAALATQVDGALVAARAAYANALASRDDTALDKASRDFEDLGAILYAAEASAEAAVVLRRAGKARQATAAEQRAARMLAHCEGAATPPVRTITARVRLTPSELDAALQAAAGRSNKQIAADMHLSVRAVESHLQRVYEKLGVSGRHELADALRDQPTT